MSFLKKFGIAMANIVGVVSGFGPIIRQITALTPSKADDIIVAKSLDKLDQGFNVIMTSEAMFTAISGQTGAQKLAGATPFIAQLVQQTETLAGKKIKNEALFIQGATKVTAGMADILNSYE